MSPRYDADTLRTFAADVIRALGGYPEHAEIVARHLVLANLVGHDSHGVFRCRSTRTSWTAATSTRRRVRPWSARRRRRP